VGCQPKNIAKNGNFWYKFSRKGYKLIPLSDFDNIFFLGEGAPGPHAGAKFHRCSFKNVALRPPKWCKMVIFDKNLPFGENFGGRYKNLNIGAQTTASYAMTP